MKKRHFLALANGDIFYGESRAAKVDKLGEAVFNTGMTGYQEIVSDPSYAGQVVTLTTAEVGNYGCNIEDMESDKLHLSGLIVQELNQPSNFRATMSLDELLTKNNVPILSNVDTRKLTLKLRKTGTLKSYLHCSDEEISEEEAVRRANEWSGLDNQDYASIVCCREAYQWNNEGDKHIVAIDYGIKHNILRSLASQGFKISVVPAWTTASEILAMNSDGVFLSNGPADPMGVKGAIETVQSLIGKLPIFGICLGHQILGIASGAKCSRLKFGHHGCNHPIKNLLTNQIEITSQNHNFAIENKEFPPHLEITHINLNDNTIAGLRDEKNGLFSVQYHPEAAPGPFDSLYLFQQYKELIESRKND